MNYLSLDDLRRVHSQVQKLYRSHPGIQKEGLLRSIVDRPKHIFFGKEIFPTVYSKGAAIMESLIRWHVFNDGNKRTGILASKLFLQYNRIDVLYPLHITRLSVDVAKSEEEADEIIKKVADYLECYSIDLNNLEKSEKNLKIMSEENSNIITSMMKEPDLFLRNLDNWLAFDIYPEYKENMDTIVSYIYRNEIAIKFYQYLINLRKNN